MSVRGTSIDDPSGELIAAAAHEAGAVTPQPVPEQWRLTVQIVTDDRGRVEDDLGELFSAPYISEMVVSVEQA